MKKKNIYPKIKIWSSLEKHNIRPSKYKSIQHLKYNKKDISNINKKISIEDHTDLQYWRLKTIDFTSKLIKKKIQGKCLEIGAGRGLASAYLSTFKSVDKVLSLDYSISSLEVLMPTSQITMPNVNIKKIHRVLGSFNKLKEKNFDFIYAFGALHNSKNLEVTLKSCYDSLKPGGYLISSDMCLPANSTIYEEKFLANSINKTSQSQYNKKIRWKDSNDYFWSLYNYIFYAKEAGFRVYPYIFDQNGLKEIPKKISDCFLGPGLQIFNPFFSKGNYDRLVLICFKEKKNKIKKDIDIKGNPVKEKKILTKFFDIFK